MDNNVDKCSAVKCTAPPPPPNQIQRRRFFLYISFCIGVFIRMGREIRCLPYAGFLIEAFSNSICKLSFSFLFQCSLLNFCQLPFICYLLLLCFFISGQQALNWKLRHRGKYKICYIQYAVDQQVLLRYRRSERSSQSKAVCGLECSLCLSTLKASS